MKILYIQPHWDDVALSQILHVKEACEQGHELTLLTFFNGGPDYKREELAKFCVAYKINNKDLALPDCSVYRRPVTRPYWYDIVKACKANRFNCVDFWYEWYEKHLAFDEMVYFLGEFIDRSDELRIPTGYFHPAHWLATQTVLSVLDKATRASTTYIYKEFPYSSYMEPLAPLDNYCSRIRDEPSFAEISKVVPDWGGFMKGGESTLKTAHSIAANASTPSIDRLALILEHFPSQESGWDAKGPNFKAHGHPNDFIERLYAYPTPSVLPTV